MSVFHSHGRAVVFMQYSVMFEAGAILFREGLEALLVIAALAAFLRRAGAEDRLPALYGGALAAILASFGMAWVFATYFDGVHSDLIEAAVIFTAAALLISMSGWLFVRQDPRVWQAELNAMAGRALGAGASASLAGVAFLAVFREGAETILFLAALTRSTGGVTGSLVLGLVVAALLLGAVFLAMQWLALRLPLRPIFLATSAFLFLIGLRLIGEGIQELQEQVIVPVHNDGVPDLVVALGFNPSWEALGAQLAVVLLAAVGAAFLGVRSSGRRTAPA